MVSDEGYLAMFAIFFFCVFYQEIKIVYRIVRGLPDPALSKYSTVPV